MSRPAGLLERATLKLARFIAGPQRDHWLDAMERELEYLPARKFDWALGSLVASVKDRFARDWAFGLALIALPCSAIVAVPLLTMLSMAIGRATGLSDLQVILFPALAPLPFALLLGMLRPRSSVWAKGLAAFAAYQLIPAIGFSLLFGQYVYVRWEANLSHYGLLPPWGLALTGALWVAGCWLGARLRRDEQPIS
jgi:hypothetical protein